MAHKSVMVFLFSPFFHIVDEIRIIRGGTKWQMIIED